MAITVLTAATTRNLASRDAVLAELPSSAAADTDWVDRQIAIASQVAETFCERIFALQRYRETIPGYGDTILQLMHTPVLADPAITVTLRGEPVTTFSLENAAAGHLYKVSGWEWTAIAGWNINTTPRPYREAPEFAVEYSAGYVLPDDDGDTTLPVDVSMAVTEFVRSKFAIKGRDPHERSVKIGSLAVSYGGLDGADSALPAAMRVLLAPYRRWD